MTPSVWNFGPNLPRRLRNTDFQSISARRASHIISSEKSSIITNRKSTTGFPMSPKWTAYVTCKSPKEAQKRKMAVLRQKVHLSLRKSATQFLYVKTVSDKVVSSHWLIYPCKNSYWWMSPSTWKFGQSRPIPFKNADFQSIFAHRASALTLSEKV